VWPPTRRGDRDRRGGVGSQGAARRTWLLSPTVVVTWIARLTHWGRLFAATLSLYPAKRKCAGRGVKDVEEFSKYLLDGTVSPEGIRDAKPHVEPKS
jgi:hypothetical protein